MKHFLLYLTLYLMATICYSQASGPPTPTQEPTEGTKEYYLQRSKTKQIKGWVFTGGGVVLTGLGSLLAVKEVTEFAYSAGQDQEGGGTAAFLMLAGVGSVIGGTISFISAGHNRRKARSLAVGYEQVPLPQQGTLLTKMVPTVSLKIAF